MSVENALTLSATPEKSAEDLYQIQKQAAPRIIYLPYARPDRIFNIDLNTRTISAPQLLSVTRDERSNVVYFRTDRYFDYMDLTETVCLVQYIVAGEREKVPYTYIVPFFDITSEPGKIIFPWVVGGPATSKDGKIQYAVRFFKVSDIEGEQPKLVYNLNTIPVTSKISRAIEADNDVMKVAYEEPISSKYDNLIYQLSNQKTQWTVLSDDEADDEE